MLDKDGDGKIPVPEFKQFMANLGMKMRREEVEEMLKHADPKDGTIDIQEFAESLCPAKK